MNLVRKKLIFLLSLIGILFSIYLVITDLQINDYCPKLLAIPACYIALTAYICLFFSETTIIKKHNDVLFYLGFLTGFLLAIWFSFNQFFHYQDCPKLLGIPMCYLSLILISIIFLIKTKEVENDS